MSLRGRVHVSYMVLLLHMYLRILSTNAEAALL